MHLSHADNTRNIVGSPISGIDPQELIDTRQLCKDINTMIIGEDQTSPEFANLPRKFNIGMFAILSSTSVVDCSQRNACCT
jgi:ferredoxin-nitrite reductase